MDVLIVETRTHGRVLVRRAAPHAPVLAGFHGYMESAEVQMARLAALPGADAWTLVSIQALHRFYRGRTDDVVAGWMTRQDRELAIADNVRYVDAALDAAGLDPARPLVHAGFSQGAAMALRAAVRGRRTSIGVVSVGGDVPPDLLTDDRARFPPVLLLRGVRDDWYTQDKFDKDVESLRARDLALRSHVYDGGHEWNGAVDALAATFLAALRR